jgi:hypothetical protein
VIRSDLDEPSREKLGVETESLRSRRKLIETAAELVQAAVEDDTLGLSIGSNLPQALAETRLYLVRPILERDESFVALPLER